VDRVERLQLRELPERLARDERLQLLDVRSQREWDAGHIPGSVFRPWHDIDAVPEGLDPERPVAVLCGSGPRAAVAASLVQRYGAGDVIHVTDGGVPHWGALGNPIERDEQPAAAVS
jgi:rhodanese-related sulfurtransferase